MRKLVLKMSISLDGFVAGPNGELDWMFRSSAPDSRAWTLATLAEAGAHIMGSQSYGDMAAFWPYAETPMAAPMNDVPKVIFSKTGIKDGALADRLTKTFAEAKALSAKQHGVTPTDAVLKSWTEPTVARGDLAEEIRRLKEQPGKIILAHGGARFAQSLVASGLVDEYRLGIHPILLGQGFPLFSKPHSPVDLKLISMTTFSTGVVGAIYRPA
ncbi:dihydrofolate reductase family protein [Pinirhizobacter soli]|uniref:dihydrofolate reductase family protein n=1 Tax=Pinirhizobacter soli TaxID=2786953 RepID=UPI00202A6928|nr:dihydrofolate reductase family protein [Pinirhizobacter soli]